MSYIALPGYNSKYVHLIASLNSYLMMKLGIKCLMTNISGIYTSFAF